MLALLAIMAVVFDSRLPWSLMIKCRLSAAGLALVAVTLAACAHKPTEPEIPSAASANAAPVPILAVTTPAGILNLDHRLTAKRRTGFSLPRGKYSYFVGGVLEADYEVGTGILRLTSLRPDQNKLACEYEPDGNLYIDPAKQSDAKSFANTCAQMAQKLSEDLTR